MAAVKIEDFTIKSLRTRAAEEGHRLEQRDTVVRGLAVRVTPCGEATWSFTYRLKGSRRLRRISLGDYPHMSLGRARAAAKDVLSEVRLGGDPQAKIRERAEAERGPKPLTFGDLFQLWRDRYAKPNLKAWRAEEARYERYLRKAVGSQPMVELDRKAFASVRDDVATNAGPIESNRTLALINRVLHWAVDGGLIPFNPAARMKKVGKEKACERVLDDIGICQFWTAIEELASWAPPKGMGAMGRPMSPSIRIALKLMLVTAQRRSEVIGARPRELHLDSKEPCWLIPGERTKNGVKHLVPLTPLAVELFRDALKQSEGSQFVFPSTSDDEASIRPDAVTRALIRLVKYHNRSRSEAQHLPAISPHDLRRTSGTLMARTGVSKELRGRVLNHVAGAKTLRSTDVYNVHDYHREKRRALKKVEHAVSRIVGEATMARAKPSRNSVHQPVGERIP
jgi:integrase